MSNEVWPAHNVASAIVESMRRHKRKPADLYPTPHPATVAMMLRLGLPLDSWIGEPACGGGDISRILAHLGYTPVSSDLRHSGYGDGGIDFLSDDFSLYDGIELAAIVTNPPFALAEQFIRKALTLAPVVAMLLKTNYWSTQNRLKLWDECTPTGRHDCTWRLAFLEKERGKSPLMDCSWFTWEQGKPPLKDRPLERPDASLVPQIATPLRVRLASLGEAVERLTEIHNGA